MCCVFPSSTATLKLLHKPRPERRKTLIIRIKSIRTVYLILAHGCNLLTKHEIGSGVLGGFKVGREEEGGAEKKISVATNTH